ncbi:MAG: 16S rRNA (cytosine(967)-C(5))-methyltransferase RsmB [Clostridia bacterium]|nr:16S rRNA (cytosine(967)-C(5))-methyltransferase RsmB [Clostridia bacterium]
MDKVREMSLKCLYKIEKNGAYSNIVLDETIKRNREKINSRDIGFISEIVYGVTTWKLTIDEIIKKHSKIKIKKISPWIINILRMGIYQILFLDKIPKSAAVNESVKLAKKYGNRGSISFTNAILRSVEKKDYKELFNIQEKHERISKTTSMPLWIVEKLVKQNGEKNAEQICNNSNLRPNLTIRINNLKITNQEFKDKLQEQKIEFEETEYENFIILKKQKNIENLTLFKKGYFTIQDLSAGLAAKTLDPQENDKVLDCCSAPGGKTTYIAEIMKNNGYIEAWDIYEHRLKLVEENCNRLGINIVHTKLNDSTQLDSSYIEKFDKILLDVPCLGIGVIKRKPDIKWQRKPEDIEKISKIQFQILETCSKYLKKNGRLVYSTCSILEEENQKIIEKFLNQNKGFEFEDNKNKYININTDIKNDGFFICKLVKKQ